MFDQTGCVQLSLKVVQCSSFQFLLGTSFTVLGKISYRLPLPQVYIDDGYELAANGLICGYASLPVSRSAIVSGDLGAGDSSLRNPCRRRRHCAARTLKAGA